MKPLSMVAAVLFSTALSIGAHSLAAPAATDNDVPQPTAGLPPQLVPLEDGAVPVFDDGAIPEAVMTALEEHRDAPLGQRIAAISEALMGTPYLNDAAGEGAAPDFDPPVRYDAFDCLTFVEEVLALSIAADPRGAAAIRDSLRYGHGETPSYQNRQHFMLQQWIPGAIAAGWVKDITAELGETRLLEKTVTQQNWKWWKGRRSFLLPDALLPIGRFRLQVLTPGAAWDVAPAIPDGAIVLTVRESKDHVPIIVTHLGFKVSSALPDKPFFRHATKMGKQPRVRNDWLRWYVEHNRWYHWWPVAGFTVLMPQEQGPRRTAIDAHRQAVQRAEEAARAAAEPLD